MSTPPSAPASAPANVLADAEARSGALAALGAYGLWGFLPLLFKMLEGVGPVGIVAERTVWSLVFLTVIVAWTRKFGEVRAIFADGRKVKVLVASATFLAFNWLLYVWAVENGRVLEASFGYFINPLVNVAMGMVMLGERQNRMQTIAIAIAVVGIAIQSLGLGGVPYVALGLALSFGFYGYIRKTAQAGPTTGLFAETVVMAPVGLLFILYTLMTEGPGAHADPMTMLLLILTGPATAIPLLMFGFAVRRLRLTTIGMFQYIAPSIQFMLAITVFGEELNPIRLLSFGLIWLSLVIFTVDGLRGRRAGAAA